MGIPVAQMAAVTGYVLKQRLLGHLGYADLVGVAGTLRLLGGAWARAGAPFLAGQIAHYRDDEKRYYAGIWGAHARRVDRGPRVHLRPRVLRDKTRVGNRRPVVRQRYRNELLV